MSSTGSHTVEDDTHRGQFGVTARYEAATGQVRGRYGGTGRHLSLLRLRGWVGHPRHEWRYDGEVTALWQCELKAQKSILIFHGSLAH